MSLASPLVPDESGASGGKTPIAAPPPTFASGRRNREDSHDTKFVEKQTLQVPFDLKSNTDYNHQGLKSGKLLKTPRNWVDFAAIVNV